MDLITLIATLVVVGVAMWLVNKYVPMDETIRRVLNIAVIIFLVLWLLYRVFGLGLPNLTL